MTPQGREAGIIERLRLALRQMRLGIAVTVVILVGAWAFVAIQGPLYGVWGWREVALGALILSSFAFAGLEALIRQPNPYARSNPLYELRDITPHRDLDSGGSGWMIQSLPLLATAILLAIIFAIA